MYLQKVLARSPPFLCVCVVTFNRSFYSSDSHPVQPKSVLMLSFYKYREMFIPWSQATVTETNTREQHHFMKIKVSTRTYFDAHGCHDFTSEMPEIDTNSKIALLELQIMLLQ